MSTWFGKIAWTCHLYTFIFYSFLVWIYSITISGERQDEQIRASTSLQMRISKPQHVWLLHHLLHLLKSFVRHKSQPCVRQCMSEDFPIDDICFSYCVLWLFCIIAFFDELPSFPDSFGHFWSLTPSDSDKAFVFQIWRGGCVGSHYNGQLKYPTVSCPGVICPFKTPSARATCLSVWDLGDTVIGRTKSPWLPAASLQNWEFIVLLELTVVKFGQHHEWPLTTITHVFIFIFLY